MAIQEPLATEAIRYRNELANKTGQSRFVVFLVFFFTTYGLSTGFDLGVRSVEKPNTKEVENP